MPAGRLPCPIVRAAPAGGSSASMPAGRPCGCAGLVPPRTPGCQQRIGGGQRRPDGYLDEPRFARRSASRRAWRRRHGARSGSWPAARCVASRFRAFGLLSSRVVPGAGLRPAVSSRPDSVPSASLAGFRMAGCRASPCRGRTWGHPPQAVNPGRLPGRRPASVLLPAGEVPDPGAIFQPPAHPRCRIVWRTGERSESGGRRDGTRLVLGSALRNYVEP